MKYTKLAACTLLAVGLVVAACEKDEDFLEVLPTGSLGEIELASKDGVEGSLIGSYSMLLGRTWGFFSGASNWFWGSVRGGDANKGSNAGDQSVANELFTYQAQSNNDAISEKYRALYEGVARSNNVLHLITMSRESIPADDLNRMEGEARFLRGHYYFELKRLFNNVPYVDENWDKVTPVSNTMDLWPKIEADFEAAVAKLPETQSDAGRANVWAAKSYLGKVYLYQGKYQEAKDLFDDVIANGQTASGQPYGLVENYAEVFHATNDNNEESIFAVQASAGTGSIQNANPDMVLNFPHGGGAPGGCCGFFQPSFDLVNSFRTDANGLPILDGTHNDAGNRVANDMGLSSDDDFTEDTGNLDPRLDHSVGRRGIPFLDWGEHPGFNWIREQAYGGPYSPKKFMYYQAGDGTENDKSSWTPGYTTVNYNIIRFADVLLMAAEADVEVGDLNSALTRVNLVRARAANHVVKNDDGTDAANYNIGQYSSFSSADEARNAVRMERKLELSGEGHRFFDLVRWGVAESTLNTYLSHENQFLSSPFAGASFSGGTDEYLPIPQAEIDLQGSDILIQNPGY